MKRYIAILSAFLLPLVFFACTAEEATPEPEPIIEEVVEDSLIDEEELVTHNVTYTGILEEGGVTIYQQGTHRLMLSDGKMVLVEPMEGSDIGLDLYVGKLVRVKGDVMPTVEAGGTIMEVKAISWIRREGDNGDAEEVLRVLCGGESGAGCPDGMVCDLDEEGMGMCMKDENAEKEEEESEESDEEEETEEELEEEEETEEEDEEVEDEEDEDEEEVGEEDEEEEVLEVDNSETVQLMIDEDYTNERWTQEYCSSHVGFCVPVHKNWYFKSFGATASLLWHIEMGAVPVQSFGDGPLTVDLKAGDLAALDVEDGAVKKVGSRVIGYRNWSDNRHFEISADAALLEPVTFVTKGLRGPE